VSHLRVQLQTSQRRITPVHSWRRNDRDSPSSQTAITGSFSWGYRSWRRPGAPSLEWMPGRQTCWSDTPALKMHWGMTRREKGRQRAYGARWAEPTMVEVRARPFTSWLVLVESYSGLPRSIARALGETATRYLAADYPVLVTLGWFAFYPPFRPVKRKVVALNGRATPQFRTTRRKLIRWFGLVGLPRCNVECGWI
jgi:hypothetical protein